MPPRKREFIEVEVAPGPAGEDGAPPKTEWRRAEVRKTLPDGRFQVCVYDADGRPDEEFVEWYSRKDEHTEWRRLGPDYVGPREVPRKLGGFANKRRRRGGRGGGRGGGRARKAGFGARPDDDDDDDGDDDDDDDDAEQ